MSDWKLIKLNFGRTPAHFGEVGIGIEQTSERVCSDTLFSAWVSAYARLFDKTAVEELLNKFPCSQQESHKQPPFRLSSTFIYRREGERCIYYLPKPLEFPKGYPGYPKDDLKFTKTYKKLNYLPLELWQRWYQGVGFINGDREELIAETNGKSNGHLQQAGTFDYGKAYKIHQTPKVAIDRTTRATNFYHTGFVQFEWQEPKQSGLYFLLNFPEQNQKLEDELHAALNLLGEEGLGGERSSGAGRFEVEWLELPKKWLDVVNFKQQPMHYSLMSLFWELPLPEGLLPQDKIASYAIQERGGWIASPSSGRQLRRQMVRMFAEGSVFPILPEGKLADVTPPQFKIREGVYRPHAIYRSGISLSLSINVQGE